MRTPRTASIAVLAAVACAAPAGAVVGGQVIEPASVPWFASIGGCGGTLVAPDRVVTAGHCVRGRALNDLSRIHVGGVVARATRFAMHPGWRRSNGDNVLDDVAIIELAEPLSAVAPVSLGAVTPLPAEAVIVGRGRSVAPGSGGGVERALDDRLRAASLRPMTDAACVQAWTGRKGNGGERFDAARMVCAVDADGRAPLSSGCNGDSGGPLYAPLSEPPALLGIVSWGGAGCGADLLPSVFTDIERYRDFIISASPLWAPTTAIPARIGGRRRVGAKLRCTAAGFATAPTKLAVSWSREGRGLVVRVGRGRTYTVRRADRGRELACSIEASNAGGVTTVPFSNRLSLVRIGR